MTTKPPSPYTVIETLHEGQTASLLRAVRNADGRRVVLKVLDPRRSRPRDLERLKREYEIGSLLDVPTAVRPLALETHEGMPALVMEDLGGESLDHLLGAPMPTERFLELAIRIAAAVAELHERDILHKDLKPQNLLVNAATGHVMLADFGLASRAPREHQAAERPSLIEGSLPYLSPEQTGRTSREIDSRADLYALGVTFYEMLTGRLPFEARDPVEWVHWHVARAPQPPSELVPELPEVLSAIVLKLLAKMAEDRYQTARGLQHDLERCLAELQAKGRLDPFPLAEHDVADRFQIPPKLYGREDEVAALLSAFERVVGTGSPELVLVSGYSGMGKSALVHALRKPIGRERGSLVSGKFDRTRCEIPYATIVQAFRELVLEILAESEERVAVFRERLLGALGINGQLIVDVIPQVELLIGRQPPAPELPPIEARNRFHIVFRRFIGVFAQRERPLALFLDDLQWADSASLALVQDLMPHPETRHLLVIGAYRENEVTPSHPVMAVLDKVREQGARVSEIVLGPLSREHLAALVSDTLHCRREDAATLSDLVHEKTAGNPFFAIQFLKALHEERLIEFDGRVGAFRWDVAKIRQKGFTDNVADLMVGKLGRLPARTREALKQLACLGGTAEVAFLPVAQGRSQQETHAVLREAVRAGLVLRTDGAYRFLHDRIREAAYSLLPEGQRAEVHLAIGRLLVSRLPRAAIEERIFDVANQLNHGVGLITDPREKEALCRLNFQAGRKAKASIAYASAKCYLEQAAALLPADAWSARYEDTLALYLELSECDYLVGEFQRADDLFTLILAHARSNPDRARVYTLRMNLHLVSGRYDDGLKVAIEALRLFGVRCPESDEAIAAAFAAEHREVSANLRGHPIADLVDAPVVTDPDVRAIIGLLVDSLACAYNVRPKLFPLNVVRALNFSLRYGNTQASCVAYIGYGLMLVSIFGDIPSGFQFSEMSLQLNEKLDDRRRRGFLLHAHADHINFWRRHVASDLPILERAFAACLEVGDLVYAGHIAMHTVWQRVEKGDPIDEILEASRKYAEFARRSHNDAVYHTIRLEQQFLANLRGATPLPSGFDDGFDEAASVAAVSGASFGGGIAYYNVMKQIAAFTYGRYAEALESAALAATTLDAARATLMEANYHFYFALTMAALYPQAPAAQQQEFAQTLDEELKKLKHWADSCPENYLNRHALVSAEVARIKRDLDALRLYEEAIRSAHEGGFVQNEALAYELASRCYRARGCDRFADTYLRDARACYARWGAGGKVQQIDQQNPRLLETRPLAPTATFAAEVEHLDLLSVVKGSQTISSELVLDDLIRTLLRVALEQGGAQKGFLILSRGDELSIEAEAALDRNGVVTNILPSAPVESSPLVPASVIHYAHLTKEPVIQNDAAADAGKFSADAYFARQRPRSVLCLPILRQTQVIGLLYLENNLLAGAFTQDRLTALSLLATQSAISMENALLLAEERAARAAAEAAERRSTFLAEAGEILSASIHYEETLARLGRMCVRSFCDWCVIDVLEGEEIRRLSAAHREPAKEPLLLELARRHPVRGGSPHPEARVLGSGEPLLLPEISDEVIRRICEDDAHARLIRELGAQSSMTVPLVTRGHTIGALSVVSSARGRRYGDADLELVQEVARRAAIAIDNARLYRATQDAIRVRDEFLTVATHELNTPMTSLTLSLDALDRAVQSGRSGDPQAMGRLVERAQRQAARLTRLNTELLEVSQIHAGRLPLEVAEVDLGAVVREVIARFKPDLARAGCSVSLRNGGRIVGLWDRSRVDQIVTNLLANAIKFGAGKPIEIFLGEEAGTARLAVRDHGIGIDPARHAQIFERFERAVSDRHYGGLGLGLYISRKIAEAHGGVIRLKSAPGAGATFTVELPRAGPPRSVAPSSLPQ